MEVEFAEDDDTAAPGTPVTLNPRKFYHVDVVLK